jgi:hypothetical protein
MCNSGLQSRTLSCRRPSDFGNLLLLPPEDALCSSAVKPVTAQGCNSTQSVCVLCVCVLCVFCVRGPSVVRVH